MTDRHGERPEGWWLASDGNWYPPKLPDPPGVRRRAVEMWVTLGLWAATIVAFVVEHNAQAHARGECALYDLVHGTRTYDFCSVPAFNWTIWLALLAGLATITTVANVWQARRKKA